MTLLELNEKVSKEYYRLLKERQYLETELRPLWNEQSRLRREILKIIFVNRRKIL